MKSTTKKAIDKYVADGTPVGDFVRAVLENDLRGAVCHADEQNLRDLAEIVKHVYNNIPSGCWGSPEKVSAWLEDHAIARQKRTSWKKLEKTLEEES